MSAALDFNCLSLFVSGIEGATIGFDMSGFRAIVACSIIPGLAPASLICQWSGRTYASSAESFANDFLRAASVRIALVTSEYFKVAVKALHIVVIIVSHDRGRLLMSNIARNSSLIFVP